MKFIQITDTHLTPKDAMLHGLNPYDRLKACIDDIIGNHGDAELCVITGDLAHTGNPDAYVDLRTCLSGLPMPVYLLAGNHDRRDEIQAVFPDNPVDPDGFIQFEIDCSAGKFLMLDTVEEGKGWGSYCKKRLAWLRDALDRSYDRNVYLFMHHPPFDVGIPSVDRLGLDADGAKMSEVLTGYDNIRHLFFGHVHRPIAGSWQGIPFTTLRGTNHQVPLDFDAVDVVPKSHEPPAYALVLLSDDQTTVHFHDYLDTYRVPYDKISEGHPDWGRR